MYLLLALSGYFLAALAFVFDRYLLRTRIPSPCVYAYFVGLFSVFGVLVAPFGLRFFSWSALGLSLLSGILFIYGLVALYNAIRSSDIMRVAPLVGSMVPVFVFAFSSFGVIVGKESLVGSQMVALGLLIAGGILLSLRFPFRSHIFFEGFAFSLLAALLNALFFLGYKAASEEQNFVSVFVWSRLGMVLGAVSLLLYPPFRKNILAVCCHWSGRSKRKRQWTTVVLFVINKIFGGTSYFLISLAVTLGSVVVVQSLLSVQYAFVIVLGTIAARFFPKTFSVHTWSFFSVQLIAALACISVGTILMALSGGKILL